MITPKQAADERAELLVRYLMKLEGAWASAHPTVDYLDGNPTWLVTQSSVPSVRLPLMDWNYAGHTHWPRCDEESFVKDLAALFDRALVDAGWTAIGFRVRKSRARTWYRAGFLEVGL